MRGWSSQGTDRRVQFGRGWGDEQEGLRWTQARFACETPQMASVIAANSICHRKTTVCVLPPADARVMEGEKSNTNPNLTLAKVTAKPETAKTGTESTVLFMDGYGEYNPSVLSTAMEGTDLASWESVLLLWIKEPFHPCIPSYSLSWLSGDGVSLHRGQAQGICTG